MNSKLFTSLKILLLLAWTTAHTAPDQSIAYFFAHGLGGTHDAKYHYISEKILLPAYPCYAYNGPEVINGYEINVNKIALGQHDDIAAAGNKLNSIPKEITSVGGFGVSKGAVTLINTAAILKPGQLKFLVLESPFADANDVAYHVGKSYGLEYIPFGGNIAKFALGNMYKNYNPDGIQPIKSVKKIPNIPIIFIHSKKDKLIPINHSRKLYRELIKQGRTNVYLVEIERGNHANILTENDRDGQLCYLKPVHAFYKQYNLPYDHTLAQDITLSKYQPSLEEITEKIEIDELSETFYRRVKLSCTAAATYMAYKRFWVES